MSLGLVIALSGAAFAVILAGIGSSIGVSNAGRSAAGVLSEKQELFGKLFLLQALPATQGIYGFLIAILVVVKTGIIGGSPVDITTNQGMTIFAACMPVAILGLISAIFQGKLAASSIIMVGKKPVLSVRGLTMTAIVETYAILGLLISILIYNGINI